MSGKFIKTLKDILFPLNYTCDICGAESFGNNFCKDCLKTVTFNDGVTCPVCGRKTVRPELCLECKAQPPVFKRAVSPLVYDGGVIKLIAKFKNGKGYLREYFARLICEKIKDFPHIDCIIYVPLTKKSQKRRGYNQTKLVAKTLSKLAHIPVVTDAVEKVKQTSEQKGLTQKERRENVKGAFRVVKPNELKDKTVLIIDDVLTTGATADEMCKVTLGAGAKCVYFAAIASVEYKIINTSALSI